MVFEETVYNLPTPLNRDARGESSLLTALYCSPNPAHGTARIECRLSSAQNARVRIFDALGRPIRQLKNGKQPAGTCLLVWDGLDSQGRPVPAGTYFVQLAGDTGQHWSKTLLVR